MRSRKAGPLDGGANVGAISNITAELLLDECHVLSGSAFAELVVWRAPSPVRRSQRELRYRLARVVNGVCVLRYDNEAGKGDHRHVGERKHAYQFKDASQLRANF